MARFEGKSLVVTVENSGGTAKTFTFVTGATVNFEYTEVEFMGEDVKSAQAGQLTAEVIVDYEYDDTGTTGNDAVLSGIHGDNTNPRFVRVQPVGTGAGKPEFAMDAVLLKYGPTGVMRDQKLQGQAVFKNHTAASADPLWHNQSA